MKTSIKNMDNDENNKSLVKANEDFQDGTYQAVIIKRGHIHISVSVKEEHIQVHVKYPPKYSIEDKKLADYLELELKAAFGRYYIHRDSKAIDIKSEKL
jgi:hypothetical protein